MKFRLSPPLESGRSSGAARAFFLPLSDNVVRKSHLPPSPPPFTPLSPPHPSFDPTELSVKCFPLSLPPADADSSAISPPFLAQFFSSETWSIGRIFSTYLFFHIHQSLQHRARPFFPPPAAGLVIRTLSRLDRPAQPSSRVRFQSSPPLLPPLWGLFCISAP